MFSSLWDKNSAAFFDLEARQALKKRTKRSMKAASCSMEYKIPASIHCKTRLAILPSSAWMSLTKLSLARNHFPASRRPDILISRLGMGKSLTFFTVYAIGYKVNKKKTITVSIGFRTFSITKYSGRRKFMPRGKFMPQHLHKLF